MLQILALVVTTVLASIAGFSFGVACDGPPFTPWICATLAASLVALSGSLAIHACRHSSHPLRRIVISSAIVLGGVEVVGYCLWVLVVFAEGAGPSPEAVGARFPR